MKVLIFILIITILSSCEKNHFEKKYDKSSNEENLKELSKLIIETDFKILKSYITECEKKGIYLDDNTYQELILEAKKNHIQKLEIKKEKEKLIEQTKLLCSKEWTEKEVALLIRISDKTEESIDKAKEKLNFGLIGIKGVEIEYSIETNIYGTFLKGILGGSFKNTYTGKNRRFEKYYPNGTFSSYLKKDSLNTTYIGDWKFTQINKLSKSIGSGTSGMYKKRYISSTIVLLNKKTFLFYEDFNQPIITSIEMEHKNTN
ncbi:hypothetical protein [Tenacibaculum mesophilum]|uniref:hypothetical protein n=1 Tax=Tenacibaculum mesophilum TaxID=104268 RepID=UPI00064ABF12|nr:hypothetical protein [Tenacibaculum mesophilum]GFD77100.1 hypothetical protein KUL113_65200 [Tenacibaculum sp. KUL113]